MDDHRTEPRRDQLPDVDPGAKLLSRVLILAVGAWLAFSLFILTFLYGSCIAGNDVDCSSEARETALYVFGMGLPLVALAISLIAWKAASQGAIRAPHVFAASGLALLAGIVWHAIVY